MEDIGVTGQVVELVELKDENDMEELKRSFRLNFPCLMATIVKVLLYKEEEKLACLLTAYYEIEFSAKMIHSAIGKDNLEWLMFVWAFGKNYGGIRRCRGTKKISYKDFFKLIKERFQRTRQLEEQERVLTAVCEWKLIITEKKDNILQALLEIGEDDLCLAFMGWYKNFLTKDTFVKALQQGNETFIRKALLQNAFEVQDISGDAVVEAILNFFEEQASMHNFYLNVLVLAQVTSWRNGQLARLLDLFGNYIDGCSDYKNAKLLLSYNPLLSIALTSDLLTQIAKAKKRYQDRCNSMKEELLTLGQVYNDKITTDAYYKSLIMDVDFNGRSVLKIICEG